MFKLQARRWGRRRPPVEVASASAITFVKITDSWLLMEVLGSICCKNVIGPICGSCAQSAQDDIPWFKGGPRVHHLYDECQFCFHNGVICWDCPGGGAGFPETELAVHLLEEDLAQQSADRLHSRSAFAPSTGDSGGSNPEGGTPGVSTASAAEFAAMEEAQATTMEATAANPARRTREKRAKKVFLPLLSR
jgi:hypothetical protein